MRLVPNILSSARILLALSLLAIKPLSPLFCTVYIICGLSDVADGALARKFKVTSSLGSLLDSIADVVLTVVVLVIARAIVNPPLSLIAWLFVILAIRLISLLIAWLRFHKTMFLHTTGNRVFGWLFFFYPFTLFLTTEFWIPVILCILATLAAFEEVLIMRAAPEFDPDIRSLRSLLAKRAHHT